MPDLDPFRRLHLPELIVDALQALVGRDIRDVDVSWDGEAVQLFDHAGREWRLGLADMGRVLCGECEGVGDEIGRVLMPCPTCTGEGTLPAPIERPEPEAAAWE